MTTGEHAVNKPRQLALRVACGLGILFMTAPTWAQPDDLTGEPPPEVAAGETDGDGASTTTATTAETADDTLTCDGGYRYPLAETRKEIGPARFARQLELQSDIALVAGAFGYCEAAARNGFKNRHAASTGPCYGLLKVAGSVDIVATNLFKVDDRSACECLTQQAEAQSSCEGLREQLPILRNFDSMVVDRAELVLAYEVCASIERDTNAPVREACEVLEKAVTSQKGGQRGKPGQFSLVAPLPAAVAAGIDGVRTATDGRFLSVVPENFMGVRQSICQIQTATAEQNVCEVQVLHTGRDKKSKPKPGAAPAEIWGKKRGEVMWGMCNELALADVNANTCRKADIYIDERGQLHLNRSLTTRKQRRNASLCIDISDFDQSHPLMVTLGLEPTGSVPERIWPGETMRIGGLIDRPVKAEDVLRIHVLGKARGVSLAEVLRINGVPGYTGETSSLRSTSASNKEACRLARAWVPVVDHEVPIGNSADQAIIPIAFDRGRDGETRPVDEGDYVVLWVRDIEPAGSVLVEYAKGQTVGYQPPPLLGEPAAAPTEGEATDGLMNPDQAIRGGTAGVGQPLLPRRARYPGSRVLRLGSPKGNNLYDLKVCTHSGKSENSADNNANSCDGRSIILSEKLFVKGEYHFGVRMHFGYSYFPVPQLVGRRTPAAEAAGENTFEVVENSSGTADYDVALLLAVYPFGRDPYRFSYKPWTRSYWKHSALLAGFTVRKLTPWEDFYVGASLPVANGVSLGALSHFSRRRRPIDANTGDFFTGTGEGDINLSSHFNTQSALVVGVSVGLTLDYDLFERAFIKMWRRFRGSDGQFTGGSAPSPDGLGGY